jgi:hypothetical protein
MSDDGDYDEPGDEVAEFTDDEDDNVEDPLLQHGVDQSAKVQNAEIEDGAQETNNEKAEESDDEDQPVVQNRRAPVFGTNFPMIWETEVTRMMSVLAKAIEDSQVRVPREHEELLKTNTGDAIRIAREWIKHRSIVPLPVDLFRTAPGYLPSQQDPTQMLTLRDLSFTDFDGGDDGFDECFRK